MSDLPPPSRHRPVHYGGAMFVSWTNDALPSHAHPMKTGIDDDFMMVRQYPEASGGRGAAR